MNLAAFLDLPDELLEAILEIAKPPLPILFELALSCTRLHHVCLQLHLKRSGILDPEGLCRIIAPATKQTDDVVAAVCLSKWITKTRRLECHFQAWQGDLKTMLFQLSRLAKFVDRLSCVEEAVLEFDPQDAPYSRLCEEDIAAWSTAIGKLLNTIVERGCHTLEINGLSQFDDLYICSPKTSSDSTRPILAGLGTPKPSPTPVTEAITSVGGVQVLSGRTWDYRLNSRILYFGSFSQDSILIRPSASACAHSKLSSFTIGSKSLLCPPLLQWTYSILACSPLSTLCLRKTAISESNRSPITTLLPMACPALERLILFSPGALSHRDITRLARTFPQLEYLSIEGLDANPLNYHCPEPSLQLSERLVELRVQLDWLLPSYSFDAKAFPALKVLTIICGESIIHTPHLLLWGLGANVPASLNLEVLAGSNISRWMETEYCIISEKRPGVRLEGYRHVTGLIMVLKFDIMCNIRPVDVLKTREIVDKWFAHFPALKRVGIESRVKNPKAQVPAIEKFCRLAMPPGVLRRLDALEVNGASVHISRILGSGSYLT